MGAGHAHALHVHGHSRVHRLAAEVKVVAAAGFMVVVALTPGDAPVAFAVDALVLAVVAAVAGLRPGFVLTRALAVVPFVLFAVFVPFLSGGAQTEVLGLSVSVEGLVAARTILCKAGLGIVTSILLAATTEPQAVVAGLGRLRVPRTVIAIAAFMLRYLEVIAGEVSRMRVAMTARGHSPRWLWQARPMAASAGALFVRSYERGERVHAAMVARGFNGTMPMLHHRPPAAGEWAVALLLPSMAVVGLVVGMLL